jgi:XTP/dITP diphosphohydrolase
VTLEEQLAQWEERKAREKSSRDSVVADLPTGQPALALAQKVISRAQQAGVPADLLPASMLAVTLVPDVDAENALRTAVLEFMDDLRAAEKAVAAARGVSPVDPQLGPVSEDDWRAAWPAEVPDELSEDDLVPVEADPE